MLGRINPIAKLLAASLMSAIAWVVEDPVVVSGLASLAVGAVASSGSRRVSLFYRTMATVGTLVAVTWAATRYLDQREDPGSALLFGATAALRFIVATGAFFAVVESTTPGVLLAACAAARVPSRIALTTALVLGLIPLIQEEYESIAEAQRARGLEVDRGLLPLRLRRIVGAAVPLLTQAIYVSESISAALSLYGFDPAGRRTTWRRVNAFTIEGRMVIRDGSLSAPRSGRGLPSPHHARGGTKGPC